MTAIDVLLDPAVFSVDVAARTAHRYTHAYAVGVEIVPEGIRIRLAPLCEGQPLDPDLAQRVANDALDDRLRERVAAQTGTVQEALVRAAFREAGRS